MSPGITENSAAGDWFREALRTTPAKAIGVADAWTIAQLVDAALAVAPALPTETPPDRRRKFTVIDGGKD